MFGPLVAAVLAGGVTFYLPKTYESVAVVRLAEDEVAMLYTAPVLDPLVDKFGLLAESGGFADDARQSLKSRLIYVTDKKNKLITITAKGGTPDAARALGGSAIALLLKELQVKGKEKDLLEKTIAINTRAIEVAEDALDSILHSFKRVILSDLAQESALKNLAVINSDIAKRSQENEALRQRLEPRGVEVFVQEPSLPQRTTFPKYGLVVFWAVLVSEFVLVMFVFVRKAYFSAMQDAESVMKIARIKRLLSLRSA